MKALFPNVPNMLIELDKLEHLMPDHSDPLCILSKTIRKNVWPKSHEQQLAAVLFACNRVFSVFVNAFGNQIRFLYKGIIINHNKKLSQPTLKRRFFKKKAAFFSWPGLGKEWC